MPPGRRQGRDLNPAPELTVRQLGADQEPLWDATLAESWCGSLLQSWVWGEFKGEFGWTAIRLLLEEDGRPAGGIQLLEKPLPAGFKLLYAPRGPFLARPDPALLVPLLAAARKLARRRRSPLVKLDPEWPEDTDPCRLLTAAGGLRSGGSDVQHRATMLLDITGSEEELLGRFKSVCRYSIRYAEKRGVEVQVELGPEAMDRFYRLLAQTAARQDFIIREQGYYRRLAELLSARGMLRVLFARVGEEVVSGAVMVHFGRRLHYLFGGSSEAHRELKPNYLLHWRAIQEARSRGLVTYDMWGAPYEPEEGERGWGYYVFKSKFNAAHVRFPGMLELGAIPVLDRLLGIAESRMRQGAPEFA